MSAIFLTGTDTDIGKTVITTLLVHFFQKRNIPIFSFKPIQTGAIQRNGEWYAPDPVVYEKVTKPTSHNEFYGILLKKASSPHLAARLEGVHIPVHEIKEQIASLETKYEHLILEGAGGLYVPITDEGYCMIDFMQELSYPVILVARAGLGTINHTVLSIEALKKRNIPIAGIIFNQLNVDDHEIEEDNRIMVKKLTDVPVIGSVPYMDNLIERLKEEEVRDQLISNWDEKRLKGVLLNDAGSAIK
ncbi:dethiobiotin synthase [Bacillus sp. FSL W8-0102]|uniref:dethiobiotin synthase n=1 Tax=Bacillus sp. FSL W8-0102 TaxID=2978205 RepID=UPI0030F572D4